MIDGHSALNVRCPECGVDALQLCFPPSSPLFHGPRYEAFSMYSNVMLEDANFDYRGCDVHGMASSREEAIVNAAVCDRCRLTTR